MPAKRNEIGYCGIHCDTCILGKGVAQKHAKKVLKEMDEIDLDSWQESMPKKDPFNYDDLKKGLKWLTTMDCKGCHAGGGDSDCKFRLCGKEKGVKNCGGCSELPCAYMKKVKKESGLDIAANFIKEKKKK